MSTDNQKCKTFYSVAGPEASCLEVDLITFRERGREERYLTFSFYANRSETPELMAEDVPNSVLNISNKEEFEKLKSFFSQLNWED